MMMLYWLQQSGNKPITLMGGGTTMVGDPSGKDESRALRSVEEIEANKASIRGVFAKVLRYGSGAQRRGHARQCRMADQAELDRDAARHRPAFLGQPHADDGLGTLRLEREQEMSFIEFNYMVCQAYDFVELSRRVDCRLQMGGSDQWGNIVNGVDLGRRMGTPQLFALTTPLLTTASGAKMGKTAQGAVWLNADAVQPLRFLAILAQRRGRRRRQISQAVHDPAAGRDRAARGVAGRRDQRGQEGAGDRGDHAAARPRCGASAAAETARQTFEEGAIAENLPTVEISRGELEAGIGVLALFVKAGLVASNGEARRQIKGGGLRVNDVAVTDEKMMLTLADLTPEGVIKLSLGKKRHVLLKPA